MCAHRLEHQDRDPSVPRRVLTAWREESKVFDESQGDTLQRVDGAHFVKSWASRRIYSRGLQPAASTVSWSWPEKAQILLVVQTTLRLKAETLFLLSLQHMTSSPVLQS